MKTIKSKRRLELEAALTKAAGLAKRRGEFKDWERFRRIGRALCDEINGSESRRVTPRTARFRDRKMVVKPTEELEAELSMVEAKITPGTQTVHVLKQRNGRRINRSTEERPRAR